MAGATQGDLYHITMHSRCGTEGRGKERACIGLPDAFALKRIQDNHIPSPGAAPPEGRTLGVWFRGIVSAGTLYRISHLR